MESVCRFHNVGDHLQDVTQHFAFFIFGFVGSHACQRCRRQAHEFHAVIVTQSFRHACDQEFHDAVDAVGAMTHEIKRPADDLAVTIGGKPAGYTEDFAIAINRIQQAYSRVDQFVDASQGESHFR